MLKHISRFSTPLDGPGIAAIGEQASRDNQTMMWPIERTAQHERRGGD